MTPKRTLEIEELEERIAPHCVTAPGGDHAAVGVQLHEPSVALCLPSDETLSLPGEAHHGIARANAGG